MPLRARAGHLQAALAGDLVHVVIDQGEHLLGQADVGEVDDRVAAPAVGGHQATGVGDAAKAPGQCGWLASGLGGHREGERQGVGVHAPTL
jgi:hypothetical protein